MITSANIACGYHAGDAETMCTQLSWRRERTTSRSARIPVCSTAKTSAAGNGRWRMERFSIGNASAGDFPAIAEAGFGNAPPCETARRSL